MTSEKNETIIFCFRLALKELPQIISSLDNLKNRCFFHNTTIFEIDTLKIDLNKYTIFHCILLVGILREKILLPGSLEEFQFLTIVHIL